MPSATRKTKVHKRKVNHCNCPVIEASTHIADFWSLWIIRSLLKDDLRFSELLEQIPTINKATLVSKLSSLSEAGLITKKLNDEGSTLYCLTQVGRELKPTLKAFEAFANKYF